jgi:hypothetical protein
MAQQVRTIAKSRRHSASRVLVELVEEGIEARQRKEKEFHDLAAAFERQKIRTKRSVSEIS